MNNEVEAYILKCVKQAPGSRPSCQTMAKYLVVMFNLFFYINLYVRFRKRGRGVSEKGPNDIIKDKIDL